MIISIRIIPLLRITTTMMKPLKVYKESIVSMLCQKQIKHIVNYMLLIFKWLFSVCISDTKLENLIQKESISGKISRLLLGQKPMSQDEFEDNVNRLYKCCLKSTKDLHELHLRRILGKDFQNLIKDIRHTKIDSNWLSKNERLSQQYIQLLNDNK